MTCNFCQNTHPSYSAPAIYTQNPDLLINLAIDMTTNCAKAILKTENCKLKCFKDHEKYFVYVKLSDKDLRQIGEIKNILVPIFEIQRVIIEMLNSKFSSP